MDTEEAIDKALNFLKKKGGYYYAQLVSAKLEDGTWVIKFDVGILTERIVTIKIDDKTGRVIEFERHQAKSA